MLQSPFFTGHNYVIIYSVEKKNSQNLKKTKLSQNGEDGGAELK